MPVSQLPRYPTPQQANYFELLTDAGLSIEAAADLINALTFDRSNAGAGMVEFGDSQVGKPYSEYNPPGSWFNGQDWRPGLPLPTYYDCDGLVHCAGVSVGIPISSGTAQAQWLQHIGGIVPDNEPLLPGDVCAFWGATGGPGNAGHTGIVQTYDAATHTGTLVNAYDSTRGVVVIPFVRWQPNNGDNGLGWIGAYRPANYLPSPTPAPIPPTPNPPKPSPISEDDVNLETVIVKVAKGATQGTTATKIPFADVASVTVIEGTGSEGIEQATFADASNDAVIVVHLQSAAKTALSIQVRVAYLTPA